jgi:hypothetical protein
MNAAWGSEYGATTVAAESLIAQLHSKGKVTMPRRENLALSVKIGLMFSSIFFYLKIRNIPNQIPLVHIYFKIYMEDRGTIVEVLDAEKYLKCSVQFLAFLMEYKHV